MGGNALETSQQYDTFGFTAAKHARKQASKEQKERLPSFHPLVELTILSVMSLSLSFHTIMILARSTSQVCLYLAGFYGHIWF
jgi:hypothetical protein